MRIRQTMTVSLPPEMVKEVERIRKAEHRTRSELIREALRHYFNRAKGLPVHTPTARELREIEKGRAAMRRGEFYTLNEFRDWLLGTSRQKARPKKSAAGAKS